MGGRNNSRAVERTSLGSTGARELMRMSIYYLKRKVRTREPNFLHNLLLSSSH